ncbi:MAG: hypothetical protein CM15mP111_4460 [Hyphomicrobiales bacterium]|nr:MAG: hypothetical protein CM15mP111_4460 [Hyphomicrobiales bacterium]
MVHLNNGAPNPPILDNVGRCGVKLIRNEKKAFFEDKGKELIKGCDVNLGAQPMTAGLWIRL